MSEHGEPLGGDSLITGLTTVAGSRKGRTFLKAALPYILGALFSAGTGVMGWAGGKLDTKAELEQAIALRKEDAARAKLEEQRHQQLLSRFDGLEDQLFSKDVRKPGRVTLLEQDEYWAWRALTEVKAEALATESPNVRARKETWGQRMAHSFELIAAKETPPAAFDQAFAKVAIP